MRAFFFYLLLGLGLFGGPLLRGGSENCLCIGSTTDAGVYVWALAWWPHALLHGLNPFFTHLLYASHGINIAHGALIPGAALLLAPVTALAGPLVAFNVAMLLSPVLAAFFAFRLCHYVTKGFWASLVGGWVFGFSTYMLGQLVGHLNLTLVFPVPWIVHLVLQRGGAEISRRRFAVLLTGVLLLEFSFSAEIFVTTLLVGLVAAFSALGFGDQALRLRIRVVSLEVLVCLAAVLLLASPYLFYALKPGGPPALTARTAKFSSDLLGMIVPSPLTAIGGRTFRLTSSSFSAGFVEEGAYLGFPLIAIVLFALRGLRRSVGLKIIYLTLCVVIVCSLGSHLQVGGTTLFPLPWDLIEKLPLLGLLLPARFMMFASLLSALLVAIWLARVPSREQGGASGVPAVSEVTLVRTSRVDISAVGAWLLAGVGVAALWPATGTGAWNSRPGVPSLFATSTYKKVIRPSDVVLILPVGIAGPSMLWHAEAHLEFRMASGYVVPPEAPDPYKRFAIYPGLTSAALVPHLKDATLKFLSAEHVTAVVLDPGLASRSYWLPLLEELGWAPRNVGGVVLMRQTGYVGAPAQPTPPPQIAYASGSTRDQATVRQLARAYLQAIGAGNALGLCALLSRDEIASALQRRGSDRHVCASALTGPLRSRAVQRYARTATVGLAALTGSHGYAEIKPAGQQPSVYLPVRQTERHWQVNGTLTPR